MSNKHAIRLWSTLAWSATLQVLSDDAWIGLALFGTSYAIIMGLLYLWEPLQLAERWCEDTWSAHQQGQDELRRLSQWQPVPVGESMRVVGLGLGMFAAGAVRGLLVVANLFGHPIMLAVAVLS